MLGLPLKKKKPAHHVETNPIEALTDIGSGVSDAFKKDLVQRGAKDVMTQVVGISMDLKEGEEMVIGEPKAEKSHHKEAALEYHREIRKVSEISAHKAGSEIDAKLEQILLELDKLIDSSSELEQRFEVLAVSEKPVEPGTYHLNFFDWMLSVISSTRQQIEDSSAWLGAVSSKKSKKSYWSMFKKHGTSFGMSNERQVATQSG